MAEGSLKVYLDNIIFWLQRSGGGSLYWAQIINGLTESGINPVYFEQNSICHNIFRNNMHLNNTILENKYRLSLTRYLPLTKKITEPAIFHSSYYRIAKSKQVKNIVTLHDFTYEKYYRGPQRYLHSTQKGYALNKADGIICISNNTYKDMLNYFPRLSKKKVEVIHNGVGNEFFKLDNPGSEPFVIHGQKQIGDRKILLYIGHRTKYKNFKFAAHLVGQLSGDYVLGVVGTPFNDREKQMINLLLPFNCIHFGNVSSIELNLLLNISEALLYPSSYEGFGIPILEAMKAGCPVIALSSSSVPEVAGGAALLSSSLSLASFTQKINWLKNPNNRAEITEMGYLRAAQFSWEKCAALTLDFYNKIYSDSN